MLTIADVPHAWLFERVAAVVHHGGAGIFAIAVGVAELSGTSVLQRAGVDGNGWAVAGGVLSILAGITLIVWPGIGAVTLSVLFGAYLFLYGAALQVSAARNRTIPALA